MKPLIAFATVLLALSAAPTAAQTGSGASREGTVPMQAGQTHKGVGVVHKVDAATGMVTLTHEPIPSLKWPQMTMDLQVADKALLKDVSPDMQVEFELGRKRGGGYAITVIRPVR